jgi:hypothetical protein
VYASLCRKRRMPARAPARPPRPTAQNAALAAESAAYHKAMVAGHLAANQDAHSRQQEMDEQVASLRVVSELRACGARAPVGGPHRSPPVAFSASRPHRRRLGPAWLRSGLVLQPPMRPCTRIGGMAQPGPGCGGAGVQDVMQGRDHAYGPEGC